jgi:hypothetical protein
MGLGGPKSKIWSQYEGIARGMEISNLLLELHREIHQLQRRQGPFLHLESRLLELRREIHRLRLGLSERETSGIENDNPGKH